MSVDEQEGRGEGDDERADLSFLLEHAARIWS